MSEKQDFSGVTHYTQVDVQPGGINIQHVEHLHQADILQALGIELEVKHAAQAKEPTVVKPEAKEQEELFHFVHPVVEDEEAWRIHQVVKRLVKAQSIQDICKYLNEMQEEKKILQPQSADTAYNELVRMGMPDTEGFSIKTFMKYYRK
ncbi:MAG: hypothetical protein IJG46_03105 [Prevotella sp.]|nr:hypothetical protein [Prevotella sp.]